MEYTTGGELFEHICSARRFREDDVSLIFIDKTLYINCSYIALISEENYILSNLVLAKRNRNLSRYFISQHRKQMRYKIIF